MGSSLMASSARGERGRVRVSWRRVSEPNWLREALRSAQVAVSKWPQWKREAYRVKDWCPQGVNEIEYARSRMVHYNLCYTDNCDKHPSLFSYNQALGLLHTSKIVYQFYCKKGILWYEVVPGPGARELKKKLSQLLGGVHHEE